MKKIIPIESLYNERRKAICLKKKNKVHKDPTKGHRPIPGIFTLATIRNGFPVKFLVETVKNVKIDSQIKEFMAETAKVYVVFE